MVERLRERAGEPGPILAHGARPEGWSDPRWPSQSQIESVARGRVLAAWCFDYHALIASPAALREAGIDDNTPDPPGGIIGRDEQGRPSGVVYERAALRVCDALPEPGDDERRCCVREGVCDLVMRHGFGELHDLKAQPWLGPVLAEVERDLSDVRVVLWPLLEDIEAVLGSRGGWESDRRRIGGAKVFVDGTLNSRTAWMLHDYADGRAGQERGIAMMGSGQIEAAVRRCDALGVPMAAHAIGDGAVRAVLDAIERVGPRTPGFRIEHCELIDVRDVPRFAELGVVASVQPCHLLYDVEALRRGVPPWVDRVLPLRDLIDSGLEPGVGLIFGSDVPIVRANPEDSIRAALHRRREDAPASDAIGSGQAISEQEAWACFGSSG